MKFFGRKEDEAERLFNSFIEDLESDGFDLIVLDKKKIKENYGQGLYRLLVNSLRQVDFKNFSIIFDKKEPRISWPSDYYPDRVVINVARGVGASEFIDAIQSAIIELRQLEVIMEEMKSQ